MTINRPLRVFLCHSSNDKLIVRKLYQQLVAHEIDAWLDEKKLLPGQLWKIEIPKAVREADVVVICLSKTSITKEGYVQREIKFALDIALEKPEGTIYLIPAKIEECKVPDSLSEWHWVNLFDLQGLDLLLRSLQTRADSLGLKTEALSPTPIPASTLRPVNLHPKETETNALKPEEKKSVIEILKPPQPVMPPNKITLSNGMEFMRVPAGEFVMGNFGNQEEDEKPQHTVDIPYDYWMARFPVTNVLYNAYAKAQGSKDPADGWEKKKDHPVVNVTWIDTIKYCQWLNSLLKAELPSNFVLRLPTEAEWEKAARGIEGREYPWGNGFDNSKCNVSSNELLRLITTFAGSTTPVHQYSPRGDSPFGCADMAGNVWEWTHSLKKEYPYNFNDGREDEESYGSRVLRGGSFAYDQWCARSAYRYDFNPLTYNNRGFRVVLAPPISK